MLNFIKNEAGLTPNRICILPTTTNVPSVISIKKQHQLTPNFINLNLKIMKNNILIIKNLVLVFCSLLPLSACTGDDSGSKACDENVLVDAIFFENGPSMSLGITKMEINQDCLEISFNSSGCNGDTWIVKLVDSGEVTQTTPPQRTLRLSLSSEELCEAIVEKIISFDLTSIQIQGNNQVLLKIANNDSQILYEY